MRNSFIQWARQSDFGSLLRPDMNPNSSANTKRKQCLNGEMD